MKFGRKPTLGPDKLAQLRARFARNIPRDLLAKEFGIATATVYRLCQHLTQPATVDDPPPPTETPSVKKHSRATTKTMAQKVASPHRRLQKPTKIRARKKQR